MTTSSNNGTVRVGVIGTGIGRTHLSGYKKTAPDAEVLAICDIDVPRGQAACAEFAVPRFYDHYQKILADPEIDAVSVCVPNYLHAEIAVAALEAGKHVLCEKPLADTLANARRIADAAESATARGQKFLLGMNNRFNGGTQAIKKFVDAGTLGNVYYAKCGWIRRNGIPGLGGWFTTKEKSGGGPLIDIGVHALDLCLYLMGSPSPVAVTGSTYAKFGPHGKGQGGWAAETRSGAVTFNVEDLAVGLVRLDNGATLVLEASWASHIRADHGPYVTLMGEKGGAEIGAAGGPGATSGSIPPTVFTEADGQVVNIVPQDYPSVGGHEAEVRHFVDCIRTDVTPLASAQQGLHVLQILDALYRSAESGQEVVI
jgi:predicted dehydrogenase